MPINELTAALCRNLVITFRKVVGALASVKLWTYSRKKCKIVGP